MEIAIATTRPDIVAFINAIARLCHFTVVPFELANLSHHSGAQVIFIDLTDSHRTDTFLNVSQQFASQEWKNKIHVILPGEMGPSIRPLFASPYFGHAIIWKGESDFVDAYQYSRMIIDTVGVTGIKGLLGLSAELTTIVLTESSMKREAVDAIMEKLVALGWSSRLAQTVCSAVDEIIMNAIYDAPTDTCGEQLHHQTARSAKIDIPPIKIQIGSNMDHFAVTTIDQFGSLKPDELFRSAAKAYFSDGGMVVRQSSAGSGIGLGLILKYGGSLRSTVVPQSKTEVSILFRRKDSMLQLKTNLQFISTFCQDANTTQLASL